MDFHAKQVNIFTFKGSRELVKSYYYKEKPKGLMKGFKGKNIYTNRNVYSIAHIKLDKL